MTTRPDSYDRGESPGGQRADHSAPGDRAAELVAGMGDATLLRGAAAVLVGFVVIAAGSALVGRVLFSGVEPEAGVAPGSGVLAAHLAARIAVAVVAGFLTGRVAPRSPARHAAVLAGLLAMIGLAAVVGLALADAPGSRPSSYTYAILILGPLAVLAGGWLAARLGRGEPAAPG